MHRRFFSQLPILAALLVFCSSVALAQSTEDSLTTKSGTSHRVKISIDERGISVEGDTRSEGGSDSDWVEISDERGVFHVKGNDIVRFGEGVLVEKNELVRGDLLIFGGDAIIEGRVTGNVVVIGGNIRARSGAEIKGDAVTVGGDLDEDDDAIIHGERIAVQPFIDSGFLTGVFDNQHAGLRSAFLLGLTFVSLILFLLVILFLRDRIVCSESHLLGGYLKSFGAGLLTLLVGSFAFSILFALLIVSIVGIPLALILIVSCFGVWIIADAIFVLSVGRFVAAKTGINTTSPFAFVGIGLLAMIVPEVLAFVLGITQIPGLTGVHTLLKIVSAVVWTFGSIAGLGALSLSRFGARSRQPESDTAVAPQSPVSV